MELFYKMCERLHVGVMRERNTTICVIHTLLTLLIKVGYYYLFL